MLSGKHEPREKEAFQCTAEVNWISRSILKQVWTHIHLGYYSYVYVDPRSVLPKILSLVCSSPRTANACSTEATGGPAISSSFDGTVRKCNSECIADSRLLLSTGKEEPSHCQRVPRYNRSENSCFGCLAIEWPLVKTAFLAAFSPFQVKSKGKGFFFSKWKGGVSMQTATYRLLGSSCN